MLVGGVSSLASTAASFNPVLAPRSASGGTSNAAALPSLADSATSANVSTSNTSGASTPNQPADKPSNHATAAPAAAPAAASATAASILSSIVSGYSTTVGGTQYLASLEQSGSEYTASVQNLLGATATDSTEVVAENDLNVRINELV